MKNSKKWLSLIKLLLMGAPLIMGFIGYLQIDGMDLLWAAYHAIRLYGFETDVDNTNLLIEVARWTAPIVTATTILMLFKNLMLTLNNKRKSLRKDSCSVYGEGDDVALMIKNLGADGVPGRVNQPFSTKYHIFLDDDYLSGLDFMNQYKEKFSAKGEKTLQIHIKVKEMSGMILQQGQVMAFSMEENCSMVYWQKYSAKYKEKIAIIGERVLCNALLEQGLLVNIFSPTQEIAYHVWESEKSFKKQHLRLEELLKSTGDTLTFYEGNWADEMNLLMTMDRIILCSEPRDNLNIGVRLYQLLPKVNLHIYTRQKEHVNAFLKEDDVTCFGLREELLTREVIIKERLIETAKSIHQHYRDNYEGLPPWEELSIFQRLSNLSAANYFPVIKRLSEMGMSLEALTELEHIRWCRFYYMHNWQYGEKKDWSQRTHPSLIPFNALSEEEKDKDKENVKLALALDIMCRKTLCAVIVKKMDCNCFFK
jgi:hypothetical protein